MFVSSVSMWSLVAILWVTCCSAIKPNDFYHMETQMKEATGKKRVGRSRTGRAPELCIALPKEVLDAIDEIAFEEGTTRSIVARDMIVDGLRRRSKKT